MARAPVALALVLLSAPAIARNCDCKSTGLGEYLRTSCRVVTGTPPSNGEPIRFWFRSIPARNLLDMLGEIGRVRVCVSPDISGNIGFKVDSAQPWPDVVRAIATKYGWNVSIDERTILITSESNNS